MVSTSRLERTPNLALIVDTVCGVRTRIRMEMTPINITTCRELKIKHHFDPKKSWRRWKNKWPEWVVIRLIYLQFKTSRTLLQKVQVESLVRDLAKGKGSLVKDMGKIESHVQRPKERLILGETTIEGNLRLLDNKSNMKLHTSASLQLNAS